MKLPDAPSSSGKSTPFSTKVQFPFGATPLVRISTSQVPKNRTKKSQTSPILSWQDEIKELQGKRKYHKSVARQASGSLDIEQLRGANGAWGLAKAVGWGETGSLKYDGFDSLDIAAVIQPMLSCNGLEPPSCACAHRHRLLRNHLSHKAPHQQLPCKIVDIRKFIEQLCQKASARYKRDGRSTAKLQDALELLQEIEPPQQVQRVCSIRQHSDSGSEDGSFGSSDISSDYDDFD